VALNKFKNRSGDLEFNEKRLAEAEKEEEDLLEASNLSEEEQIEKLSKTVARKRVLERKIEHGCNEIEGAEVELEHATKEAFRSFDRELSDLRSAREQKHMTALKKLVEPEQWHWAQVHAGSFVQYVSDLMAIKWLGYQAQIYSTMAPSKPAQSSS
jgi:chromosome segregation ATPase